MENSADGSGGFQDLLSAALSESGLTDDLFDLSEPTESIGSQGAAAINHNAAAVPSIHDNSNLATLAEAATSVKTSLDGSTVGQTSAVPNGLGGTAPVQVVKQVATLQAPSIQNGVAASSLSQAVSVLQQRPVTGQSPAGVATGQRISSPQIVSSAQPRIPMRLVTRQVAPGTVQGQQAATSSPQIRMISAGQQVRFVTQSQVRPANAQQQQAGQPVRVVTQSPSGAQQIRMVRQPNGQTVRIIRHPGGNTQQMHIVTQPKTQPTTPTTGNAPKIRLVNSNTQQVRMVSGSPQVRMVTTPSGQQIRVVTHPPGKSPIGLMTGNNGQVRMVTQQGQVRTIANSPGVRMVSQTSAAGVTNAAPGVQTVATVTTTALAQQTLATNVTSPQANQPGTSSPASTMKVLQTSPAPATSHVIQATSPVTTVPQVINTSQQPRAATTATLVAPSAQNNVGATDQLNASVTVRPSLPANVTESSKTNSSSPLTVVPASTTATTAIRPVILGQTASGQTILGQSMAGGQTIIGKNAAGQTVIRRVVINQSGTPQTAAASTGQTAQQVIKQVSASQIGGARQLTQLVQTASSTVPQLTQSLSASQVRTQPSVSVLQTTPTTGRASPIQLITSSAATSGIGTPQYVTTTDAAGNRTLRIVSMAPKTPTGAYTIQRVGSSPALLQGASRVLSATNSPASPVVATSGNQQLTIHATPSGKVVVNPLNSNTIGSNVRTILSNKMVIGGSGSSTPRSGSPSAKMLASALTPGTELKKQLTAKDVSRLWVNEDIKLKKLGNPNMVNRPASPMMAMAGAADDMEGVGVEEEEELGHAETYADYWPKKVKIGEKHPDQVVETSSLSSVEPPDVWYKLSIPETTIDYGHLSAVQLESITYTCQKHSQFLPSGERAGYIIGDGAGVGKGRTIAGVIFENYLQGRKRSLWLSVSNDLRVDAERDLRDIGAGKIEVHPLNKFKYAKISSHVNGSVKKGVIFSTYSALIGESQSGGKYRTRFKQLLQWMSKDFDGVIVFDECHRAKNLCPVGSSKPTKTGLTVLELQKKLPKSRIVYASATGASEPRNMAYMTRLGLWGKGTPFKEFNDFIQAIEKRGVGAMELVAMDMKLRGMYIARQLSFQGVTFRIQEVPVPHDFVYVYNAAVDMWVDAREKFQRSADLIDAEHRMKKSMWGQFWSAHQRFFKYLCISAKVPYCVKLAREAVKNGKCVVIGLQSTGEARTLEAVEEAGGELTDFVSTAKGVFQTLVEKHFPAPDRRKTSDMFGLSRAFSDSPVPSPKAGSKRKKDAKGSKLKRARTTFSSDDNSDTSESDDDDDDDDGDDGKSSDQDATKPSSESEMSLSESGDSSEPDDDFNPFGNGSDSDDDPWLKKSAKKSAKKNKPAKVKKEVEKKEVKKQKEKKKKKKKKKKRKKGGFHDADDDSDLDDIDNQFDAALEAAGLKSNNNFTSQTDRGSVVPGMDAVEQAIKMKRELLDRLEFLGEKLPPNTLDELIDCLGGPESVAEMTGRKGRVVSTDDGTVQYESRSETDAPLEILNLTEKQRFMDGEKNIAVISEAASSGISLQADRRAVNQRRRVHITLELPWSADRAIQQFGRTHRSNQVSAPEYVFMISELAGERRFAATVAKRLESLGALTHGDRRATESRDLSQFNIDNKYGRAALEAVMKSILGNDNPMVSPPADYTGNFFEDCKVGLVGVGLLYLDERFANSATLEKDYNNISKFLNRILGMKIELQNSLFKYFTDTLTSIILQAKRFGRWDMGILDLGTSGEHVRKINCRNFKTNFGGSSLRTQLHTVAVERGMTWQSALTMWRDNAGPEDGFYIASQVKNGKQTAILAIMISGRRKEKLFNIFRPNTGLQLRSETLSEIKSRYKKVLPDNAEPLWQDQYQASANICSHAYWRGNCKRASVGLSCEVGLRCRTYYILSGSVLGCWTKVESVLASLPGGHATRMQIMRLKADDGSRIVGSLIPEQALVPLTTLLSQDENPGAVPAPVTVPSITSSAPMLPFSATIGSSGLISRSNAFAPQYPSSRTSSYRTMASDTSLIRTNSHGTSPQPVTTQTNSFRSSSPLSRLSSAFSDATQPMPLKRPGYSLLNSSTSSHSPGVTSHSIQPKRTFVDAFPSSLPSSPASQPASPAVDTSIKVTSLSSPATKNPSPPPSSSSEPPPPSVPKPPPASSDFLSMPTFV